MTTDRLPAGAEDESGRRPGELERFLFRPIVFEQPLRVVFPPSWVEHIPFAFWLIDAVRPAVFVELGTHTGNSYSAFLQAVQHLRLPAAAYAVDTWKGDPQAGFYGDEVFEEWASYHDRHYSSFSTLIRSTFAEALPYFSDGTIDLLHVDGYHTYDAAAADLELWTPKLSARGVVVIHDINVRERDFGTWRLWEELRRRAPHFAFLHGHGLGIVAVGPDIPLALRWLFSIPPDSPDTHQVRTFFAQLGAAVAAKYALGREQRAAREPVPPAEQESLARLARDLETARGEAADRDSVWHGTTTELERTGTELASVSADRDKAAQALALSRVEISELRLRLQQLTLDIEEGRSALDAAVAEQTRVAVDLRNHLEEAAHHRRAEPGWDLQRRELEATLADWARFAVAMQEQLGREVDRQRLAEREWETERDSLYAALGQRTQLAVALQEQLGRLRDHSRVLSVDPASDPPQFEPSGSASGLSQQRQAWAAPPSRSVRTIRRGAGLTEKLGWRAVHQGATYRSMLAFLTEPAKLRDAYTIDGAGLFDAAYYEARYPDVSGSELSKLAHFVLLGAIEGRSPHPLFQTDFYIRHNPDVAATRINPVTHYLAYGAAEGRSPHPLFDIQHYLATNPDVAAARQEPLTHFLTYGAQEGRSPNPFFDPAYYLSHNPDVARRGTNPLVHFVTHGWQEGRRPSAKFDPAYYLTAYPDVRAQGVNPLVHYLEFGLSEGRHAVAPQHSESTGSGAEIDPSPLRLRSTSLVERPLDARPVVVCLSHVMPFPPRAGNEYRIYRMLRWLRDQGYRVVPVIAPLPGVAVDSHAVKALADEFSNAVLCDRDGRVEYILTDVPDVLGSLDGLPARPIALLLGEDRIRGERELELLQVDRTFCHDALITTVLRLHEVLGPYVLLAEYIWMSRILPLMSGDVLTVIDTIDVFSNKHHKVVQFGIDDHHVESVHEAARLRSADVLIAIQDEERRCLEELVPGRAIVTAGVDFDVIQDEGTPTGRQILYVASDNPMNTKGLRDFLRFAWPVIRRTHADAELLVAGSVGATIPGDVPGVRRLGRVDDLGPLYRQARFVINPAVAGTGLKIKTVEALSHFRPVVTWPSGVDGLASDLAALCIIVNDWYEFAKRASALLAPEEPRLFSEPERQAVLRLQSPARVYAEVTRAFDRFFARQGGEEHVNS